MNGEKKIGAKGVLNGGCKLTPNQVMNIRKDRRMQRIIAREYGVTQSTISRIKRGTGWTHI